MAQILKSTRMFSLTEQIKKRFKNGGGNLIFCLDVEIGKREIPS
jgi:GTPase